MPMRGGKLVVVAGGQYGSEGKGAVAAALTSHREAGDRVVGVRVAGPNAGHTVIGGCPPDCTEEHEDSQHPWRLRSVPVAAVSNPEADLVIAAGSEVDFDVLATEIEALDKAGYDASSRLIVDSQATVLTRDHITTEQSSDLVARLGSTAKGIGAARAQRIWREADIVGDRGTDNTAHFIYNRLGEGYTVVVEGTQGYGLGLHAGHYPQCTSSDCRAIDFLSMAGVSPWHPSVEAFEVWLACRVRPIRVAGNSGPLKGETTWDNLGLPAELTTVTKKVRRVGEWDSELVAKAVEANGGTGVKLALTMVDTVFPELAGYADRLSEIPDRSVRAALADYLLHIEMQVGATVRFVGTGPDTYFWA